jgi:hypothetical protein
MAWEALFRAYIDFYQRTEPPEMYDRAWREFATSDQYTSTSKSPADGTGSP